MKDEALTFPHGLKLPARMESLHGFLEFIGQTAESLGLEASLIPKLKLAGEELLVNVVHYAYSDTDETGDIELRCGMADPETFCMAVLDQGTPFNPLSAEAPDLTEDIDQRPVGGLGVFLVREMADRLDYCRADDTNVVLFCKKIQPETAT
ncbi:MAG: ATP-binding protein [Thermodesulfobacteriota bacterium]